MPNERIYPHPIHGDDCECGDRACQNDSHRVGRRLGASLQKPKPSGELVSTVYTADAISMLRVAEWLLGRFGCLDFKDTRHGDMTES